MIWPPGASPPASVAVSLTWPPTSTPAEALVEIVGFTACATSLIACCSYTTSKLRPPCTSTVAKVPFTSPKSVVMIV